MLIPAETAGIEAGERSFVRSRFRNGERVQDQVSGNLHSRWISTTSWLCGLGQVTSFFLSSASLFASYTHSSPQCMHDIVSKGLKRLHFCVRAWDCLWGPSEGCSCGGSPRPLGCSLWQHLRQRGGLAGTLTSHLLQQNHGVVAQCGGPAARWP